MSMPPKILASTVLAESRQFQIEAQRLQFANGAERTYERLVSRGHGAVLVVPIVDDERFLLIREWGAGTGRYELGFPKGKIDAGETPLEAALREAKEEVGFGARRLTLLPTPLTLSPAYMTHCIHIVVAEDLYPETADGDEPEPLEVVPWRWDHLDALLAEPTFSEARSIAALWLTKRLLAERKDD